MPESVTDRPTTAHEFVFLLGKNERYYYDRYAVQQACGSGPSDIKKMVEGRSRIGGKHKGLEDPYVKASAATHIGQKRAVGSPTGRNWRTSDVFRAGLDMLIEQTRCYLEHLEAVRDGGGMLLDGNGDPGALLINPSGFKGAHFAVFPQRLVEPCIKAGTSERGCCPQCGSPWVRVMERTRVVDTSAKGSRFDAGKTDVNQGGRAQKGERYVTRFAGWQAGCKCPPHEPIACRVLDPFLGAGTAGLVAARLGRDCTGIELNPEYATMAERRIREEMGPLLAEVEIEVMG